MEWLLLIACFFSGYAGFVVGYCSRKREIEGLEDQIESLVMYKDVRWYGPVP